MAAAESVPLGGESIPGELPCATCQARGSSICSVLSDEDIGCLNEIVTRRKIDCGRRLFLEGDGASSYFVVTEGSVKIFKESADGRRQITGFLFQSDMLGLNHHQRYAYTAEAIVDTVVCQYPIDALNNLFTRFPEMEHWMLRYCSNELASAHDQMFLLGRKTASEKIATFFLFLAQRGKIRGHYKDVVHLPMSRGDIADYLGLTVETVSRTITRIRKSGSIKVESPHEVEIRDYQMLRDIAGADDEWGPATALAA